MDSSLGFLIISLIKIAAIVAYLYALLNVLGHANRWVKIGGVVLAFALIQFALSVPLGDFQIFNDFDRGLLFQALAMTLVALGLNLIYGFNGQFSLGQWGFYGIGAYTAADVTYRWSIGDASGLIMVTLAVALIGLVIWGVGRLVKRYRGMPVLSAFTLYLLGTVVAAAVAGLLTMVIVPALAPLMGTSEAPGILTSDPVMQIVMFFAVILAGGVAAEVAFLFGLPVLTLGSDYFGIATLGFTIVVNTLMNNSDTILPFPEMRGGRGMISIPQMGPMSWVWGFIFLVLVIVVMRNLIQSTEGRAVMSVREDETAAKIMGIDVANYKLVAFMVGSLFAGIGGGVYAHTTNTGFLSPGSFDFLTGFNPLIIVVFGGLGSMSGTIAASFGWIFFLEGLLRNILGNLGTEAPTWRYVLYPLTLLLLMLLRPQGLLGTTEWGFLRTPHVKPRVQAEVPETTPAAAAPASE